MGKKEKILLSRTGSKNLIGRVSSVGEDLDISEFTADELDGFINKDRASHPATFQSLEAKIDAMEYHEILKRLLKESALNNLKRSKAKPNKIKTTASRIINRASMSRLGSRGGANREGLTTKWVSFNIFGESNEKLFDSIQGWISELHLETVYDNDSQKFKRLVTNMQNSYKNNPFHNWQHAFSVAQTAVMFFERANLDNLLGLNPQKILAFIIGALGHDIEHPGNDNIFQIRSQTDIAELYRHQSVLENHHASTLLKLLIDPDCNVFSKYDAEEQLSLQTLIVDVVLATDMKLHDVHVETLQSLEDLSKAKAATVFALMKDRSRVLALLRAVMHACDLSGQCLNLNVAIKWEDRITQEMANQCAEMESKGLEIPIYIRDLQDPRVRASLQREFIETTVMPLWKEIVRVFPSMNPLYENLTKVVVEYYKILENTGEQNATHFAQMHFNREKGEKDYVAL